MPIQRNRPEAVRATKAPVPSAEDVVGAFAGLTHDRLKDLLSSFVDNVLASGSPRFDLNSMLVSVPQGRYFVVVSTRESTCRLVYPPSRLSEAFAAIGLLLMLGGMPIAFAIAWLWSINDVNDVWTIMGLVMIGGLGCVVLSWLFSRRRRPEARVPAELHKVLLMILPDALATRRSWMGIRIVVKLAGAGLFDQVAEMVTSGEFAKAFSNLLDTISDGAVEKFMDRDQERVKSGLLARTSRFATRPDAASLDWQVLIQRHAGAVRRHSSKNGTGRQRI